MGLISRVSSRTYRKYSISEEKKMGKITKFQDLDKPSGAKKTERKLDIFKKSKKSDNKSIASHYMKKYLSKKDQLQSEIESNITNNKGPKSKQELTQIKFDLQKITYNASTPEQKRKLERERLLTLGAKKPKKHDNYKDLMNDIKAEAQEFTDNLQNFSKSEQNILVKNRNKERKAIESKKMKGDKRFFQVKNTGGLKSGGKVGKFKKSGVLSLTRGDVRNM